MSDKKKTARKPATGKTKDALEAIEIGEEYEVYVEQTKKGVISRAKVVEAAIPLPGFVTDVGVRVVDKWGRSHEVHVKWVVRKWSDRLDAMRDTYEERAKAVAKTRATSKKVKALAEQRAVDKPDWSDYAAGSLEHWFGSGDRRIKFTLMTRDDGYYSHTDTNTICLNEPFKIEGEDTVYFNLGVVSQSLSSRNADGQRHGIIHGFTPMGSPRILWFTKEMKSLVQPMMEVYEDFDEDAYDKEYEELIKKFEEDPDSAMSTVRNNSRY